MRNDISLMPASRTALGPTMDALVEVESERRFALQGPNSAAFP
jgi:hypothetical protein